MANKQQGQIRVGNSGPVCIGETTEGMKSLSSPKVKRRYKKIDLDSDLKTESEVLMTVKDEDRHKYLKNKKPKNKDMKKPKSKDMIVISIGGSQEKMEGNLSLDRVLHAISRIKSQNKSIGEMEIYTVGDILDQIIDQMKGQYPEDLANSPKNKLSYVYPLSSLHSFRIVSENHIKYLKNIYSESNRHIEIEEIDWSDLPDINWNEKKNILVHPFLYPFASYESFLQNSRNFARLLSVKNKIGGFDVADSNRISKVAVDLVNKIDLMIVPSNFVKDVYLKSGVTVPVEVVPHGVPDEFLRDDPIDTDNIDIKRLIKMKKKGKILILYFLIHSGHRKGADSVRKVMKKIQKRHKDVCLVVKSNHCSYFSRINRICVESWMNNNDLRLLYDICDICISPSRGGGFELNALEAVSRGVPTLVTNGGCFLDLIDYFIPIEVSDDITQPLPGNPIHDGFGYKVDSKDFERKLSDVIDRLDYWKNIFKERSKEIRDRYSWRNSAKTLDEVLRRYRFIE